MNTRINDVMTYSSHVLFISITLVITQFSYWFGILIFRSVSLFFRIHPHPSQPVII